MRARPQHRTTGHRAFTLVEVTIAMLIIGVMLVSSLGLVGMTARTQRAQSDGEWGPLLAQELMAEIVENAYEEPVGISTPFVPDAGETSGTRSEFDDVDDYHGWAASPPETSEGTSIASTTGWTRSVQVTWAMPGDLKLSNSESGVKRIEVTVTSPSGIETTIAALRTSAGLNEWAVADRTYTSRVGIAVQTENDAASRMTTSVALVNEPATNVLENGDVESGEPPWTGYYSWFSLLDSAPHGGGQSALVNHRSWESSGAKQAITKPLVNDSAYQFEGWFRMVSGSDAIRVKLKIDTSSGTSESVFTSSPIGTDWTRVTGQVMTKWTGTVSGQSLFIYTVADNQDFEMDDVVLMPGS